MKAPDKIYAMVVAGTLYADTKQHEVFNKPYAEYIRKDALLEWIQTELKLCESAVAMTRAYHKLIDKLNSL